MSERYYLGIDVGSTTVKMVLQDSNADSIIWQHYQRHETKQPETVLLFLRTLEQKFKNILNDETSVYITGSGGKNIARYIGAKFVQEVNAVCLAVEKFYPKAGSVIELGGQDAKIIVFKEDPETGRKKIFPSMNDKCAGGTGAVIDKINSKLRIPAAELSQQGYDGIKLHHVAGKCGVFAETDINSLQKLGIPNEELMASLFEAIVNQNLSVLTRGHILRPEVLLLGGPNTYIKGMLEAFQENIPLIWKERNYTIPDDIEPKTLIKVPENAQYFAAIGAIEFAKTEAEPAYYKGYSELERYMEIDRHKEKSNATEALSKSQKELDTFIQQYTKKKFVTSSFKQDETIDAFMGIDGGSTSTKAVLLDKDKNVLVKAYQLSGGNPIEDTKDIVAKLHEQVLEQGAKLNILGVVTTGYAKDILKDVLGADAAIVETVAHTESALHFYKQVDVICDVGGQDIKVMMLKNGQVKDFKLNSQCSAGNGYFLQSTSNDFGVPLDQYAKTAFDATTMPIFGYGCAVFMQSDIVNFQRQGWSKKEIMAGLAAVLPKNIWLYVCQITNLTKLGTNFVLQGGTQYNLAVVKAQVDFIRGKFQGSGKCPNIVVHDHCGESGAIGSAIEAVRLWRKDRKSTFIGLDEIKRISYTSTTNEDTRCHFCKNKCLRTFIDVKIKQTVALPTNNTDSQNSNTKKLIVGNSCEKGLVYDIKNMRQIKKKLDYKLKTNPNFVTISAKEVFKKYRTNSTSIDLPKIIHKYKAKQRAQLRKFRAGIRIGMPRVLNMFSNAPLFTAYFASLGIKNVIFSDYTSEQLYKDGIKRGAIDPCFPSKLCIPHVHNLIAKHNQEKKLDYIFFPMISSINTSLKDMQGSWACTTITATPEAVKAAFTKEGDFFKENNIEFINTFVDIAEPKLFARQMYNQFKDFLRLSATENDHAVKAAYAALNAYEISIRKRSRIVLDKLERENKIGIVMLGRPYHNDPGINHDILVEFQKLGYPIFTQDSLPMDADIIERLFGDDLANNLITNPLSIDDVWKNSYSENTNRKIWAAKFVARHPNLVALELSNFKCGHDATIYSVIEEIIESSKTPYFNFKDLDENKPAGSIKIRVETISYFLKRHHENMLKTIKINEEINQKLHTYEKQLREKLKEERQFSAIS